MKLKKFKDAVKVGNYGYFLASMLLFGAAFGLFKGVMDNYMADILNIDPFGRGVVEFFRELPGLSLFLILALFYKTSENRILRYGFAICLAGMGGVLMVGNNIPLFILFLTIWSMGEHIVMPVRQSFAVHSAKPGQEGVALGIVKSLGSVGRVAGFFLVPLIFLLFGLTEGETDVRAFRFVFILVICAVALALLFTFKLSEKTTSVKRQRLYFKKKYTKYYILEIFYGGRKQIFLTFAPYVLILKYGAETELVATLLGICAVINIFFTPLMGKVIDKMGYKMVMVLDTVFLFFVCLAYGFAHRIFSMDVAFYVVCITFVLDWMISNASMAASVYVNRISDDREEMTSTLSTGISINHVISVAIALAGGMIWKKMGIELLFVCGAVMAVCNSLFALTIPKKEMKVISPQ